MANIFGKRGGSLLALYCVLNLQFSLGEDYYSLLGISRSATGPEIRRAFKNLALKQHPDKNKDDPQAHERFTRLNKAYEVLKDEELRKKYDLYGEEGLKDDHFGEQYKSWDYYNQEFGIYDNDPEIITLSHGDFEQSVASTSDIWFINFYSPYCSHCHDLAPTWREVARELDGVVRIGAINCNDEWNLCSAEGIQGYPSLKLYPTGEHYQGQRTTRAIVDFLLQAIDVHIMDITSANLHQVTEQGSLPWILSVCSPDEDCLSAETELKLAAMLDNLANVGRVTCIHDDAFCNGLGYTSGVVFYSDNQIQTGKGQAILSLNAKDIVSQVLNLLPGLQEVTEESFKDIAEDLMNKRGEPWLLLFVSTKGEAENIELRRLPTLVSTENVGFVNCGSSKTMCERLFINKFPIAGLFKHEGFEWHYGRFNAHDIAVFSNECSNSNVHTLGPDDFPGIISSGSNWFVDFFAPWCPPCMKLLPEFRKAGKQVGGTLAKFGTVDCTVHSQLCQLYNIRSYPTTVFYNNTMPHHFTGFHKASDIVEFIKDTISPTVINLTPETFESFISGKPIGETWVVDFYAPWCGPCMELAPTYRKLAKRMKGEAKVGQLDCQQYNYFCQAQGITAYPSIFLYPHNSAGSTYFIQHNGWRDLDTMYYWVFGNLPSKTKELDYYSFYSEVIESRDAWVIDFYAPWCGHCVRFAPEYEKVAKALKDKAKCGKVNCQEHNQLCREIGINSYPSIKFYPGAFTEGMSQPIHGENVGPGTAKRITATVKTLIERYNAEKAEEERRKSTKKASHRLKDEF